jgi:hypothetical protein
MQTTVCEIVNPEYCRKFDYFILKNCIYKTIVFTLVSRYGNRCRQSNLIVEDPHFNQLFNECLATDNTEYMYDSLGNPSESETIVALMPLIEIYIDKLFLKPNIGNRLIIISVNIISKMTTQLFFKIIKV